MRCLLVSLALSFAALASPEAKLSDPLNDPGWQHFYNNEFSEALASFEEEARTHPDDPDAYNHVAQAILYREMLRNGALESQLVTGTNPFLRRVKMAVPPEVRSSFNAAIDKSIELANGRIRHDPKDVRALYALSVSHGLRANYLFLVEKAWTDALRDATASRKYSNRILAVDPQFVDAYLVQGLHDYIVGSLPFYMRMLGFLSGFHGDAAQGLRELENVAQNGVLNKYDARILLAAIYRRERRPREALALLKDAAERFPRNYLLRLEQVQMYSDAGDKASALRILDEVERLRAAGSAGFKDLPPEKIKYLRGNLFFWYGDLEPALEELKQVAARSDQLDLNTALLAWLRVGQLYDLRGDHAQALEAYRKTMKIAPESPVAEEAKHYISSPYHRKQRDLS
jgi:tetratricopeptide (TPR) repeat protein